MTNKKEHISPLSPTIEDAYQRCDPVVFMQNMMKVADRLSDLVTFYAENSGKKNFLPAPFAPSWSLGSMAQTLGEVAQSYLRHPEELWKAQWDLWCAHLEIWQQSWKAFLGEEATPTVFENSRDKRFSHSDWEEQQVFQFLKHSYLLTAQWARGLVARADIADPHVKHKAQFYMEQIANALSPSNFALTNPEILKLTLASNGENLVQGLEHLFRDVMAGDGELKISQTDFSAFKVGENLANTPGKVVFRNSLMELIHYTPRTKTTHRVPLLIIPPWINKFYILDLTPEKSFIRWCVDQGFSVFVVSWVNPGPEHSLKTFSDYMHEGVLEAMAAIERATGDRTLHVLGYCVGGTLLAVTLGYLAATGSQEQIASATFLTTQVDFSEAGDMLVFIDEEQIQNVENHMEQKGYLEATQMSQAFNLLRSNDLIWSYVVNNYLKGRSPLPFDLLYWNSDCTRMPAKTHAFYLRECYLNNALARGELVLDGVQIDLRAVTCPVYNLAARDDHIAPLASVFKLGDYFEGARLVVAGSGHIAGVINPPSARKYSYWTREEEGTCSLDDWLKTAEEHPGSWWEHWVSWLRPLSGPRRPAPCPGEGGAKALGDAPGSYVQVSSAQSPPSP